MGEVPCPAQLPHPDDDAILVDTVDTGTCGCDGCSGTPAPGDVCVVGDSVGNDSCSCPRICNFGDATSVTGML